MKFWNCLLLFVLIPAFLGAADPLVEWQSAFANAENQFNSRDQLSCVPLLQSLVDKIQESGRQRALSAPEFALWQKSLDYMGQAYFNNNQQDQTRNIFIKLAELNANYKFDEDMVSPKVIDFFVQVREQALGRLTISSDPAHAIVKVDGREIGPVTADALYLARGNHTIEVGKPGFRTQAKTATISESPAKIHFALESIGALATTITNPGLYKMYEAALISFEKNGNKSQMAGALEAIGSEMVLTSEFDSAQKIYEEALSLYQEASEKTGIARVSSVLSDVYVQQSNRAAAEKMLDQTISISRDLGDTVQVAVALSKKGDLLFSDNRLQDARVLYEEALPSLRDGTEKEILARTLFQLGEIAKMEKKGPVAAARYQEALVVYREINDQNGIKRTETASKSVLEQMKYELGAVLSKANTFLGQQAYAEAESKFEEGAAMARLMDDKNSLTIALVNLGYLLNKRGDPDAEKKYEEALESARQMGDKYNMTLSLLGIGFQYSNRRDFIGAQQRYQEALDLARASGDKRSTALALYNLANTVYMLGDQKQANQLYEESVANYNAIGETPHPRLW